MGRDCDEWQVAVAAGFGLERFLGALADELDSAPERLEELRLRPEAWQGAPDLHWQLPDRRKYAFVLLLQITAADYLRDASRERQRAD